MTHSHAEAPNAGIALRVEGLRKSFGAVPAVRDVSFDVPPGAMIALIGPSGCGKTTTLRMIAGLERPNAGRILAGDRALVDGTIDLPPEQRDLGMVFQSYALWPHMTVFDNVAYGLKRRGVPRAKIETKVADVLTTVGMTHLASRYPGQLSGGQQQRVALSRAIATEPGILLFDEPLSNLDAVLRERMRFEIRALQQRLGITGVYVTHSQDEALAMSDRIAVMLDGEIVQLGPPKEIYDAPRTKFVAGFIGLANILTLTDATREGEGLSGRLTDGVRLVVRAGALAEGRGKISVCVRPVDISIHTGGTAPAGRNVLRGRIRATAFTGGLIDYFVALVDGTELRVQSTPPSAAEPGAEVDLAVSPDRCVALLD